jgi:hypothetical protein
MWVCGLSPAQCESPQVITTVSASRLSEVVTVESVRSAWADDAHARSHRLASPHVGVMAQCPRPGSVALHELPRLWRYGWPTACTVKSHLMGNRRQQQWMVRYHLYARVAGDLRRAIRLGSALSGPGAVLAEHEARDPAVVALTIGRCREIDSFDRSVLSHGCECRDPDVDVLRLAARVAGGCVHYFELPVELCQVAVGEGNDPVGLLAGKL